MSRRLIQKAQQELDNGDDLIQASEKAWGAVAHGLKSIAALRGWNHHHHLLLEDLAAVLQLQTNSAYILDRFDVAEKLHTNFYENRLEPDTLQHRINRCRELRDELERIRTIPPPAVVPEGRIWERRMRRLTNRDPNLRHCIRLGSYRIFLRPAPQSALFQCPTNSDNISTTIYLTGS
jgi:hypothetical protein